MSSQGGRERRMMKIQIPKCDVDVTDALRVHVERRLGLALARFADRIERVTVRFSQGAAARATPTNAVRSK
jgi:hypothetical protein